MAAAFIDDLRDVVGDEAVATGDAMGGFSRDWRGVFGEAPIAVVRPAATDEVAAIVQLCGSNGVPIVTQGGNTGMSGGAVPDRADHAIVLSTARMRRVVESDTDTSALTAEAGCTIEAAQEAAASLGRKFSPDWGARGSATLGAAVATNAGGMNVLRYGSMRENVLGLEAVLADGSVFDGLRSLRKDSSGPDLRHLLIGSEGTLGIVTRVVARLHPTTPFETTAIVALPSLDALCPLFELAGESTSEMSAFELVPEVGLARVVEVVSDVSRPIAGARWYALIRLSSARPVAEDLTALLSEAEDRKLIGNGVVAATPLQEQNLWRIRDELPPTGLYEWSAPGLKGDTAVPVGAIAEYIVGLEAIVEDLAPGAMLHAFGHVGDGNLHTMVLPSSPGGAEAFERVKPELSKAFDELTWRLGGTISAEHGIGQELGDRIGRQKSQVELAAMRSIRRALDPAGLLNPQVRY